MAAFDFPASPTVGDVYTPVPGTTYTWDGVAWIRGALASNYALPPGVIMPFAGDVAPKGALFCFGQEFNRNAFAALFAIIGTKYGAGNGTTTANLPDLRGRTVLGRDEFGGSSGALANRVTNSGVGNPGLDSRVLGAVGGFDRMTLSIAQSPAHTHTGGGTTGADDRDHVHLISGNSGTVSNWHTHSFNVNTGNDAPDHTHWVAGATDSQGSHQHGYLQMGTASNTLATGSNTSRNNVAGTTDAAGAHTHNMAFASGGASARHIHNVAGSTGTDSDNHSHGIYFNSQGRNTGHLHAFSFTSDSNGGGEAHANLPPSLVLNYIIFTGA